MTRDVPTALVVFSLALPAALYSQEFRGTISGAVTDPSARAYGVDGLRVADASIMPSVPCANTNIPTIMIGEKVAATILAGE